jgi:N-methylhydantoinase B
MPLAEELLQEGIVIPPLKLYERGRLNRAVYDLLLRNMRNPEERKGDLDAQAAAHRIGEARFAEIVERYGLTQVRRQMRAVMDYAQRMTQAALAEIADGVYEFEDFLDDDGVSDEPVRIRIRVTIDSLPARGRGGTMHCDFSGSSPQRPSSVNAVAAVTRSAVYYVVRCLLEAVPGSESVPSNDGCFRPVSFTLPEGSVVNATPPHAVAAGNVETSQRIVDVLLGALAPALPDRIPAASAGTMNNVSIGGWDAGRGRSFAYYETVGGGAGAGPSADGLSAVHTHMTNTMNTPVEALEFAYPFRLLEYAVRRGSGGRGHHRGGDGIRRTWEFLAPATVSLLTERRRRRPWGLADGGDGATGRNLLIPSPSKGEGQGEGPIELPSKGEVKVQPGDRLTLETPGGGGWG